MRYQKSTFERTNAKTLNKFFGMKEIVVKVVQPVFLLTES